MSTFRYREVAACEVGPYCVSLLQNARGQTALSVHYDAGAGQRVVLEGVGQIDPRDFEKTLKKHHKDLEASVRAAGSKPGGERLERSCMRQLGSRVVLAIHTPPAQAAKAKARKPHEPTPGGVGKPVGGSPKKRGS